MSGAVGASATAADQQRQRACRRGTPQAGAMAKRTALCVPPRTSINPQWGFDDNDSDRGSRDSSVYARPPPQTEREAYPLTNISSIDRCTSMAVDLELVPKPSAPPASRAASPSSTPTSSATQAERMAVVAKALGDPIRLQLVDVLRKHAGKVCVCELVPLFDISQPTLSPPPQEAARRRHRRLRAPWPVGLLLRHPRRPRGADRMAELTHDSTTNCCCPRGPGHLLRARGQGRLLRDQRRRRLLRLLRRPGRRRPDGTSARPSASATPPPPAPPPSRAAPAAAPSDVSITDEHGRGLRRRPLRATEADGVPDRRVERVAGLRRPDRHRRPARGRDRPRPRLRRRRRRPDLRPPRRPHRQGHRA